MSFLDNFIEIISPTNLPVFKRIHSLAMIRTTLLSSVRCVSRLAVQIQRPVSRTIASGLFVKPTPFTPIPKLQSLRWYSAPAALTRVEVEGRIMDILKNFDKVRPICNLLHTIKALMLLKNLKVTDSTKVWVLASKPILPEY